MKKILSILIAMSLTLSLVACDKEEEIVEQDTNLYTTTTDSTEMDFTYEGKDFITDGVGEVSLVSCTDGDTARFSSGGQTYNVRFLGIDTPESTYRIDPWGKAASEYTCDKLTNAETIVLESEGDRTDGNERYLAWIWYDGKLLNLELVEQAYSKAKGLTGSKYDDLIYGVELDVQQTDRRVWGEIDPDYDYSLDGVQITIEELVTNPETYTGTKIVVTGVVALEVGVHPYVVDENGYGIYIYLGYDNSYMVEPGNEIRISGLTLTWYPDSETGSPQLVGFYKRNIELLSENNEVIPRDLEIDDFTVSDLGSFVKVNDVTVTEVYVSNDTGNFTVTVKDSANNVMGLYIDASVGQDAIDELLAVGTTVDVSGALSRYYGQYQLNMSSLDGVVKK